MSEALQPGERSMAAKSERPAPSLLAGSLLDVDVLHDYGRLRALGAGERRRGYLIYHVHALDHPAEYGVIRRQGVILVHDEELAGCRFRPSPVGHCDRAALVAARVKRRAAADLVRKRRACGRPSARAVSVRVASLNHEAADDAMEFQVVIKAAVGEHAEVFGRLRGLVLEQLDLYVAGGRLDDRYGVIARGGAGLVRIRGGLRSC